MNIRRLFAAGAALAAFSVMPAAASAGDRPQATWLMSRAMDGGLPNGPSTNAVISNDRRWSQRIAFESTASDLTPGDTNGHKDVFVIPRAGSFTNNGSPWHPGTTSLVSRGMGGQPANGPSWAPAVSGNFKYRGRCVAFLSAASNLVPNDTNGKVDAFLVKRVGGSVKRVSLLPGNVQSTADTTIVDVSGDCKRTVFLNGGQLYVRSGRKTKQIKTKGTPADPAFSEGKRSDLVFATERGIYLAREGRYRPRRVVKHGQDPVFNDIKRQTLAYEVHKHGHWQVVYRDLGRGEVLASARRGEPGNGDSYDPVIGNSGYYVTFESTASNLGTTATGRQYDDNGAPDVYIYTDVRKITLVQSVGEQKGVPVPGGGTRPSMSFYANYITFQAASPLGAHSGPSQIFMRWLGPL